MSIRGYHIENGSFIKAKHGDKKQKKYTPKIPRCMINLITKGGAMSYLDQANASSLYITVGIILLLLTLLCVLFIIKSYRAGVKIGMKKEVLRRAITSSATFTILPSVSILLGVIALSGTLGVPASWLRLSVVGNLQYEATVANIAAENMGTKLDASYLNMNNLVTILLVMTIGIIWGCIFCIFLLKPYSNKLAKGTKVKAEGGKPGFASFAMTAMMIGLCATFIGSYIAEGILYKDIIPVVTLLVSGLFMSLFEYLSKKKGLVTLESFSLALSMLAGMASAVILGRIVL